jgi:hypothetical protein
MSPGIAHIAAQLIKAGSRTVRSEIHKLINSIWNKKEMPETWKKSIIVSIYKKGDKKQTVVIIEAYLFVNYIQNFIQHPAVKVR